MNEPENARDENEAVACAWPATRQCGQNVLAANSVALDEARRVAVSDYQIVKLERRRRLAGRLPRRDARNHLRDRRRAGCDDASADAAAHRQQRARTRIATRRTRRSYLVLRGKLQFKLDDEIVEAREARGDQDPAADLAWSLERRARGCRDRHRLDAASTIRPATPRSSRTSGPSRATDKEARCLAPPGARHPFCAPRCGGGGP